MIGDATPGFQCHTELKPFEDKQFEQNTGKCQRVDAKGSTLTTVDGVVFDRDACVALCKASNICSAAQFAQETSICITWQETVELVAEGSEGHECFIK